MNRISLQMIDKSVSSDWWKDLVGYFGRVGDDLEIRCWNEEYEEIQKASVYGYPIEDHYEVSIKGRVCEGFLEELLSENPTDKLLYNKMTKYFTININRGHFLFCSAHYGTEMYWEGVSDEDVAFFLNVMKPYGDSFSVHTERLENTQ